MLQQTTVVAVLPYYETFLTRFPDGRGAGGGGRSRSDGCLGGARLLRPRPQPACLRQGRCVATAAFRATWTGCARCRGSAPYTAAAIAAIAFGVPAVPIDGNVERVAARLFAIYRSAAGRQTRCRGGGGTPGRQPRRVARPSDFAQALFDLGATICTPTSPACGICPMADRLRRAGAQGIAAELPRKAPKRCARCATACTFWLTDTDGRVLLRRRPPAWPAGRHDGIARHRLARRRRWDAAGMARRMPRCPPTWRPVGEVRHGFTHFELRIACWSPRRVPRDRGRRLLASDRRRWTARRCPR